MECLTLDMGNKYGGMTVNERLYVSGFINKFEEAVAKKNIREVVKILKQVELADISISPILSALGLTGQAYIEDSSS